MSYYFLYVDDDNNKKYIIVREETRKINNRDCDIIAIYEGKYEDDTIKATGDDKSLTPKQSKIFNYMCESYQSNIQLTYMKIQNEYNVSQVTIHNLILKLNTIFNELGFNINNSIVNTNLNKKITCNILSDNISPKRDLYEQYLEFDEGGERVSSLSNDRFDKLPKKLKYKCLMIYGEGGIGKTEFLRNLHDDWTINRGKCH